MSSKLAVCLYSGAKDLARNCPQPGRLNGLYWLRALAVNAFKIYPGSSLKEIRHQFKFVARGLSSPRLTQQWLEFWQTPKLAPLADLHPRMLLKLQRPYLRRGLPAADRWAILQEHYAFALQHFPAATLRRIHTGPGILLARLPEIEAGRFSLRLSYHDLFEKEGEWSVVFYDEQGGWPLFALSFCISSNQAGRREIFIGGLQGYKVANCREHIVAITRGLYGLRPKALLLFALQQFAADWDIAQVRAVSNATRDLRGRAEISADYDSFWLESGGYPQADHNFTLPARFARREIADLKPNKRAMYRHRYQLLDDLAGEMRLRWDQICERPIAPNETTPAYSHAS